jgi:histidinol phosphatase-like PHP family hydrolase
MEKNPSVSFITHPYSHSYPVIIDDVVKASLDCGVLLEVNASLVLDALRDLNTPRRAALFNANLRMVELLQKNKQGFVINSDAHHTAEIGINDMQAETLYSKLHIECQYVLNNQLEKLKGYIQAVR